MGEEFAELDAFVEAVEEGGEVNEVEENGGGSEKEGDGKDEALLPKEEDEKGEEATEPENVTENKEQT